MRASRTHRVEQILKIVQHLCDTHNLHMYTTESRRGTDVLRLSIWGERQDVLKVPFSMLEYLFDEDIEIMQSGRRGQDYLLLLVITERLFAQEVHLPERRKKLHGRLEEAFAGAQAR